MPKLTGTAMSIAIAGGDEGAVDRHQRAELAAPTGSHVFGRQELPAEGLERQRGRPTASDTAAPTRASSTNMPAPVTS